MLGKIRLPFPSEIANGFSSKLSIFPTINCQTFQLLLSSLGGCGYTTCVTLKTWHSVNDQQKGHKEKRISHTSMYFIHCSAYSSITSVLKSQHIFSETKAKGMKQSSTPRTRAAIRNISLFPFLLCMISFNLKNSIHISCTCLLNIHIPFKDCISKKELTVSGNPQ